jgi:hypothetical protein
MEKKMKCHPAKAVTFQPSHLSSPVGARGATAGQNVPIVRRNSTTKTGSFLQGSVLEKLLSGKAYAPGHTQIELPPLAHDLTEEEKLRLQRGSVQASKMKPILAAWWYSSIVTVPLAWVLSYKRNKSLGWAFLSGAIATPYVIYRGIEYGLYERKKK